jgi:hypothetical protein
MAEDLPSLSKGRVFFSEEKKQKTFTPSPAERSGHAHHVGGGGEVKVFWFFSSEKNILPS